MKKVFILVAIMAIALAGCVSVNLPAAVGDGTVGPKTGQASGSVILGMFGNVDAGIVAAARNGGITNVGTVDVEVSGGFFITTYTTTVTGN
uniref:Lipoprotein n=1 Tax=uncultured bacterium contig00019 TaxID=1181510 RepID=A0A806KM01_9BACT|nr:hypothetical protein [uncultured bacterium contig00019]